MKWFSSPSPQGLGIILLAGVLLMSNALAQSPAVSAAFPSKPVRIVVPYPPGGFNDTLGRLAANQLSKLWKQAVV